MPVQTLPAVPGNSLVFIDANIFIYGLSGQSVHCRQLLERCLREEVTGITLFETLSEVCMPDPGKVAALVSVA